MRKRKRKLKRERNAGQKRFWENKGDDKGRGDRLGEEKATNIALAVFKT